MDEIDEITNRSGKPHGGFGVEGRSGEVIITFKALATDGRFVPAFTLKYSPATANELVADIRRMADAPSPRAPASVPANAKSWLQVDGRSEPAPAVELSLWTPGKDGATNVIRVPYDVDDARGLADDIEKVAYLAKLEIQAAAGDANAAELLEVLLQANTDDDANDPGIPDP